MKNFNLSRWALEHKSFVVYLMLVVALAGIFEYRRLGRDEDPPFTIKTMVVKTLWPGATALETMQQVTDRIEKSYRASTISRVTPSRASRSCS
jgi:multidrug efflux pump subunit AcrB